MNEIDDIRLIQLCKDGEKRAWYTLIEKYNPVVFNLAYRMLNDRGDAEDVTQSVFAKIVERLDEFNPKYKFFSWMYRIALNESLNYRRSKQGREQVSDNLQSVEKSPLESYEASEASESIQQALLELSEEYRAVVILKHLQGLSYEEIGNILDLPEKTVKSRLFTARLRLRDILVRNTL